MGQYNGLIVNVTTYLQVVAMFGAEGVPTEEDEDPPSSAGDEKDKQKVYTWSDAFGGTVTCTFRGDKLSAKSQSRLR